MHVLAILAHPRRDSFSGAIFDGLCAGLTAAGHTVEVGDLYGEGFDPLMRAEDYAQFESLPMPPDVLAEQERIERADALAFVFPVWWWSLPAMLKGWIDRVWNNGWAYGLRQLPHSRALLLATASGSAATYQRQRYDQAMDAQLLVGTMNYCGIARAKLELFFDITDSAESRAACLASAQRLGLGFALP